MEGDLEYWWCTEQILMWPDGKGPNMILDDGGDATLLVHKGKEFEAAGVVPSADETTSEEYAVVLETLRRSLTEDPQRWTAIAAGIKGVTEETTTGVHRLYSWPSAEINVNDSVTKSKFDNPTDVTPDRRINRATDDDRRRRVVCGFGDVARAAPNFKGRVRVIVTEIDLICALQAPCRATRSAARDVIDQRHLLTLHRQQGHHSSDQSRMKHQATGQHRPLTTRSTWPGLRGLTASSYHHQAGSTSGCS